MHRERHHGTEREAVVVVFVGVRDSLFALRLPGFARRRRALRRKLTSRRRRRRERLAHLAHLRVLLGEFEHGARGVGMGGEKRRTVVEKRGARFGGFASEPRASRESFVPRRLRRRRRLRATNHRVHGTGVFGTDVRETLVERASRVFASRGGSFRGGEDHLSARAYRLFQLSQLGGGAGSSRGGGGGASISGRFQRRHLRRVFASRLLHPSVEI